MLENLPKTNNAVEGWHRSFESTIQTSHANFYKLVNALKKEHTLMEKKYEEQVAGEPPTKRRKVYQDCAMRLQHLVAEYTQEDDVVEYLCGVAYNFTF